MKRVPKGLNRRQFVGRSLPQTVGLSALLSSLGTLTSSFTPALAMSDDELEFPRDHGAHTDFRTEWWYITGQAFKISAANKGSAPANAQEFAPVNTMAEPDFGFQLTFFRSRVEGTQGMRSKFAAKQLIFAHAAITDIKGKKLWHDQRIARASGAEQLDLATFSKRTTAVELRDWSLKRTPIKSKTDPDAPANSLYQAILPGKELSIRLQCRSTQPLLLQGNKGLSRKGPQASQTSYYVSEPQLSVRGTLGLQGQSFEVNGTAWLDHEWSEESMPLEAVGWDWIGMNLHDGSALTAFRLRDQDGKPLWDGGSFRSAAQAKAAQETGPAKSYAFAPGEVVFRPMRYWKSPASQATYPVEWLVRTPVDLYTVRALIDDQELDSRKSTGAIYWEGLCELLDSKGRRVGRGYLEMTGYAGALRL